MFRPIMKYVAFLIVFVLVMLFSVKAIDRYAPLDARSKFIIGQLSGKANRIEALSLGSSHARALDFGALDLEGYTVWQPGQDIFEIEYQVKALAPRLPNLKTVFISVSYYTLKKDNSVVNPDLVAFPKCRFEDILKAYPELKTIDSRSVWTSP